LDGRFIFSTVLSGLPIVMLTVEGARSKRLITIPLVGIPAGDRILLVASNWGGARHPAWYHNIVANPEVALTIQGQSKKFVAHEAAGAEREGYWQTAVDFYPGYGAYQDRTGKRSIPIMVLEPK
jgi:deazaflavin-dependent oxidoreductase (nitroreductase family)